MITNEQVRPFFKKFADNMLPQTGTTSISKEEMAKEYAAEISSDRVTRMFIANAYLAGWNDRDKLIMNIKEVEYRSCGNCRHEKEEIDGIICHPCTDQNLWEEK